MALTDIYTPNPESRKRAPHPATPTPSNTAITPNASMAPTLPNSISPTSRRKSTWCASPSTSCVPIRPKSPPSRKLPPSCAWSAPAWPPSTASCAQPPSCNPLALVPTARATSTSSWPSGLPSSKTILPWTPSPTPNSFQIPLHNLSRNPPLTGHPRLRIPRSPVLPCPDPDPDDDIPPAIGPDGPIDFEANFYDPALSPFWMEPPEMIATMPGREKKSVPKKPEKPERSARWYSPHSKPGKELFLFDFPRKRLHSGRSRPHRRKST